jgi:hypothetical protein
MLRIQVMNRSLPGCGTGFVAAVAVSLACVAVAAEPQAPATDRPTNGNASAGSKTLSDCDQSTGLSQQMVILSVGDQYLAHWSVVAGETRPVVLPNGFRLGIKIGPASREEYAEWARGLDVQYLPEMVEITLFDLTTAVPRELTHTWGGANSLQGYGPGGGADRVDAVGSPGIMLFLHKPNCVRVGG